jgi:hypothetical protein
MARYVRMQRLLEEARFYRQPGHDDSCPCSVCEGAEPMDDPADADDSTWNIEDGEA